MSVTRDAMQDDARAGGQGRRRRWLPAWLAITLIVLAGGGAALLVHRYVTTMDVVVEEDFSGADATFVDREWFYNDADQGRERDATWFANDGSLEQRDGAGHTDDSAFRMWSWRTDLVDPTVTFDLTFHGFSGGDQDWRGANLWLNRTLCTPAPECSRIDDPGGNSGYMLRFFAADGFMVLNKKIAGDTREDLPEGATTFVQGGTYYYIDKVAWEPEIGRTYELEGSVRDNGDGTSTITMKVDGETRLEWVDDGSIGGSPLTGGRLGLRGDYADMTVDNLEIRR